MSFRTFALVAAIAFQIPSSFADPKHHPELASRPGCSYSWSLAEWWCDGKKILDEKERHPDCTYSWSLGEWVCAPISAREPFLITEQGCPIRALIFGSRTPSSAWIMLGGGERKLEFILQAQPGEDQCKEITYQGHSPHSRPPYDVARFELTSLGNCQGSLPQQSIKLSLSGVQHECKLEYLR